LTAHPTVKFRISSLEPREVSREMMELMAAHSERFCAHFHLPLQSGSDPILKRMRREYDRAGYAAAVELVREFFPEACIGADVIPGFPGESLEDHHATLDFVKQLELAYLHVFPYSKRPNTSAAKMPHHLEPNDIKERARQLRGVSDELEQRYYRRFLNRALPVIWEDDSDDAGRQKGHTENYLNVVASSGVVAHPGTQTTVVLKGFVGCNSLLAVPL
jgi:threonylcarbamoyladenosine tRNA methylthiotransferase MtaB